MFVEETGNSIFVGSLVKTEKGIKLVIRDLDDKTFVWRTGNSRK